jgi:hypothetical protein
MTIGSHVATKPPRGIEAAIPTSFPDRGPGEEGAGAEDQRWSARQAYGHRAFGTERLGWVARRAPDENVSTTVDEAAPTAFVTPGGHDLCPPGLVSGRAGDEIVHDEPGACSSSSVSASAGGAWSTSRVLESDDGYAVVSEGCLPLSGCALFPGGVREASAPWRSVPQGAAWEWGVSRVGIAEGFGLSVTRQAGDGGETARRKRGSCGSNAAT